MEQSQEAFSNMFFTVVNNHYILGMTYKVDVKTTQVFDSCGNAFLEGTRLLPQSNLHWFIGKPNTQTGALGLHMNLDIKSFNTIYLMTVDNKSFDDYKLWHAHLGHLHKLSIMLLMLFVGFLTFQYQVKHQFVLTVKLKTKENITSLFL